MLVVFVCLAVHVFIYSAINTNESNAHKFKRRGLSLKLITEERRTHVREPNDAKSLDVLINKGM